jgi:hypothetical protein
MAKNALQNVHGYSPYQLVFGRTPNLPSVLTDKAPALEGTTVSQTVFNNVSALHAARIAFTQAECSERIRRALRRQIRPGGEIFNTGEKVYYKRPDGNEWKGPGTVIGQDGVVVFVRHGGSYVRVHTSRLSKVPNPGGSAVTTTGDNNTVQIQNDSASMQQTGASVSFGSDDDETEIHDQRDMVHAAGVGHASHVAIQLKPGQTVRYLDASTGEHCTARVISRAGKATGRNKHWYNLKYSSPEQMSGVELSVDLSKVQGFECVENDTEDANDNGNREENILVLEDLSFASAKCAELQSWKTNQVYVEKPDSGQKCVSTRWVCTLKETPQGIKPKARLVARGFEEIDTEKIPKDSPTCSSESLRMILAVFAQNGWKPNSIDIKTAFLQGSALSRDIFVRPPSEAKVRDIVWLLRKCVYGLSDASLQWYNRVKEVLLGCGAKISRVDPAVFYWMNDDKVQGVLACHVDDFIWGGSSDFEKTVICIIRSTFCVGREHGKECETFSYVGIEMSVIEKGIHLQQKDYIENLCPIPLDKCRMLDRQSALTDKELNAYRSKVGQIVWIARQTRPDILFDGSNLASLIKHATVQNIIDANKVIRKLTSDKITLKFQFLGEEKSLQMVIFSDASLGNLPDGGTQGGHLIMLTGNNGRFSPLAWQSKRIRRIVRSTLAGETLAMSDGIDSGLFLATLFAELTSGQSKPDLLPIICVTDNQSLHDAVKSTKFVADKRLRLEISSIKEMIQHRQIKALQWIDAKSQLADCLTKKGASSFLLMKALDEGMMRL